MTDFRRGADDENIFGPFMAIVQRNLAVGFVSGEDNIGTGVVEALCHSHTPIQKAALVKFRLEHFGPKIVHIEDHFHSKQFKRPRDDEEKIRRIAEVDEFEFMFAPRAPGEGGFAPYGGNIFQHEAEKTVAFDADAMAINLDAFDVFLGLNVAFQLRTNANDFVTGVAQSEGFLPDAPVEGHGQIFDDD